MTGPIKKTIIITLILVTAYLHYTTEVHYHVLHVLHREMFLVPIILAAYWYGKKTGLLIALISSVLFLPKVMINEEILSPYSLNNLWQVLMFFVIAYLLGGYQDIRKSRYTQERRHVSPQETFTQETHNTLVCIDNSQNAFKVIPFVMNNLAMHRNMSVTLLGLIREPSQSLFNNPEEYAEAKVRNEKIVYDLVEDGRNRLLGAGFLSEQIHLKIEKLAGASSASKILDELQNASYDHVIIGGTKMTKTEEFVLGNTAVRLVRQSDYPVIVVY